MVTARPVIASRTLCPLDLLISTHSHLVSHDTITFAWYNVWDVKPCENDVFSCLCKFLHNYFPLQTISSIQLPPSRQWIASEEEVFEVADRDAVSLQAFASICCFSVVRLCSQRFFSLQGGSTFTPFFDATFNLHSLVILAKRNLHRYKATYHMQ